MHRHAIGKIQVIVGIIFIIFTIGFSFYIFNNMIQTLSSSASAVASVWGKAEVSASNAAHVVSSLTLAALTAQSEFHALIFGTLILSFMSVMMILQGLANMGTKKDR